jgi:hypothetical protein
LADKTGVDHHRRLKIGADALTHPLFRE